MVDVTDSTRIQAALRERATALEQADRVKTDFVANMSYELRTPLTSIGGFAEMLAGGYAGKLAPAAADYVDAILEAVARLSKLIDDVLDLTQGDTRGIVLERERVDLPGCAGWRSRRCSRGRAKRTRSSKWTLHLRPGFVFGDARRLRELIEHVLDNAIAYTDQQGPHPARGGRRRDSGRSSGSSTTASAFPSRTCRASSIVSTASTKRASVARRRSALACRSLGSSSKLMAGRSSLNSKKGKGTTVTLTIPRGTQMILADEQATAELGARIAARPAIRATSSRFPGRWGWGRPRWPRGSCARSAIEGEVPSPSFAIVQPYDDLDPPVWHVDLFRIEDRSELDELGLEAADEGVLLVEWPEKAGAAAWPQALGLTLEFAEGGARRLTADGPAFMAVAMASKMIPPSHAPAFLASLRLGRRRDPAACRRCIVPPLFPRSSTASERRC